MLPRSIVNIQMKTFSLTKTKIMNQYEISEFPVEVIKKLKFYVYRLIDPRNGETFYVGKGQGNRMFQHSKGALTSKGIDGVSESNKMQKVRQIMAAGLHVIHVIHRPHMEESVATEVESALIDAYPGTYLDRKSTRLNSSH